MLPELFREAREPKASRPNMPGYGVLDADSGLGLLPWSWATERLSQARTYWLSTTRPDRRPHAMPIWGVWMNSVFCFSTGEHSRKARNLEALPYCVISATTGEESVVLEGVVWLNDDGEVRRAFAATYGDKYQWNMDTFVDPVRVVYPVVAYGFSAAANEFTGSATRWTFATTEWNRMP
jgi:nitroimidazol reductase NimA-like FMN-containing flavoprotein (pyridoxamine 5'-phosphate oxidase superfamily)